MTHRFKYVFAIALLSLSFITAGFEVDGEKISLTGKITVPQVSQNDNCK
ncbi:MAG: hypothetical protein P8J18_05730 [Halieaceae bacterium]|nr:hypothetical protein [Halieaceae bacterium]